MDPSDSPVATSAQPAPGTPEVTSQRPRVDFTRLIASLGLGELGASNLHPDCELVMETLDAEMARIEQAIIRTGWTSWVGTAALAGIVWVFVSLFDTAESFPWSRFAVLTTFLSFIQEFIYTIDHALRPRRGLGPVVGDQMRMVRSSDMLPFARAYYLFEGTRGTLLAAASWSLLPEFLGWAWLLPFVWYCSIVLTKVIQFALSLSKRLIPKKIKFFPGELIRSVILVGLAVFGLHGLAVTHDPGSFLALKAALLAIAAAHVLRGLTAPRFELPTLESLREIRRKLGFGQMAPLEAVLQADIALQGINALLIFSRSLGEVGTAMQQLRGHVIQISDDLALLTREISTLDALEALTHDDLRVREALARAILSRDIEAMDCATRAEQALLGLQQRLDKYAQETVNDTSLPLLRLLTNRNANACTALVQFIIGADRTLIERLDTLAPIAARHQLTLAPDIRESARAFLQKIGQPVPSPLATPAQDTQPSPP